MPKSVLTRRVAPASMDMTNFLLMAGVLRGDGPARNDASQGSARCGRPPRDTAQSSREVTISYINGSYWHSAGMEITTAGGPPAGRTAASPAYRAADGHPR
ncbi:hypothetical protein GCM10010360_38600 [Streptomyces nogalater]